MARYVVRDQGVALAGFGSLARTLRQIEGAGNYGVEYELRRRLGEIGVKVGESAKQFITHKTGRGDGALEDSVRVAVTQRAASVYSTSPYGGAQNVGAYPKAGRGARGPHIQARNASRWMNRGVASERAFIEEETEGLLDWLVREFESG